MTANTQQAGRVLLRRIQVEEKTGLARSTIYKLMSDDGFPPPIRLGGARTVYWVSSEVEEWLSNRIQQARGDRQQAGASA